MQSSIRALNKWPSVWASRYSESGQGSTVVDSVAVLSDSLWEWLYKKSGKEQLLFSSAILNEDSPDMVIWLFHSLLQSSALQVPTTTKTVKRVKNAKKGRTKTAPGKWTAFRALKARGPLEFTQEITLNVSVRQD